MDTNIENYGADCPDCEHLERKLDKERGRHQQDIDKLQSINHELLETLKKVNHAIYSSNMKGTILHEEVRSVIKKATN